MIAIIDYGLGNLGSIQNMLKRIGVSSLITSKIDEIKNADKLILPGVGAFDVGMKNLNDFGLLDILNARVLNDKVPVLGICLGMQLMAESSEEGIRIGLGWIKGSCLRFKFENGFGLKVPHMEWNEVTITKPNKLIDEFEDQRFYFVHSYYLKCAENEDVMAESIYGFKFTCAVSKDNILGVQFHPEKSHKFGMQLLKNFIEKY
jgi:imidazole glycerol-phosphate synthase subunit HisH